jgi:ubiquinone/menaquinone biosynthesis C-methylase UbiE
MTTADEIRSYWEARAQENADSRRATTNDVYLRSLEIATITETIKSLALPSGATVLDLGCGDGYTTIDVARAFPNIRFVGLDFSPRMIENARRHLCAYPQLQDQVVFEVGDARDLQDTSGPARFDAVLTDRCLINLATRENQSEAIAQIGEKTRPGGHYIAIENFTESQENMNAMRKAIGLPEIPVRWHNLYFQSADFVAMAAPFFDCIGFTDFASSYYFATRMIYAAICQINGTEPDYEHEIHKRALALRPVGQLSPVRLVLLRRKQVD